MYYFKDLWCVILLICNQSISCWSKIWVRLPTVRSNKTLLTKLLKTIFSDVLSSYKRLSLKNCLRWSLIFLNCIYLFVVSGGSFRRTIIALTTAVVNLWPRWICASADQPKTPYIQSVNSVTNVTNIHDTAMCNITATRQCGQNSNIRRLHRLSNKVHGETRLCYSRQIGWRHHIPVPIQTGEIKTNKTAKFGRGQCWNCRGLKQLCGGRWNLWRVRNLPAQIPSLPRWASCDIYMWHFPRRFRHRTYNT